MPSRPGFPKDREGLLALANQYRYRASRLRHGQRGDERPLEIGERSRKAGVFSLQDFLDICDWKTHRSRKHCLQNSDSHVREATGEALAGDTAEDRRIKALLGLHGVSLPTASVLLHFAHEDRYPIIDVRALWSLGYGERYYIGLGFWHEYVQVCRALADRYCVSMRDLDRALLQFSRENQKRKPGCG